MRNFLLRKLQKIVKMLARLTVAKFRPAIIGVTGTVGKTSTKEAIYTVLSARAAARRNPANLNNELGLPLAILGNYPNSGAYLFWLGAIITSSLRLILPKSLFKYPRYIILEYAADRPGDLAYLISVARPDISVVTAVGDIPVHVEFYENAEAVAREKSRLVEALPPTGTAILNADDPRVLAMQAKTKANIITYGFSKAAALKISDLETHIETDGLPMPTGISFKLQYSGTMVPVRLPNTAGKVQAYAAAAAACVGLACKLNLVEIADALAKHQPPAQRLNFLAGKNDILLIDDSYNASPLSMSAAIETVKEIPAKRKVAILGDMRELGKFSEQAHKEAGAQAEKVFDVVIAVGAESKVMAAAHWYPDVASALPSVQQLLKAGDLVLVKASHSIGLEKIVAKLRV